MAKHKTSRGRRMRRNESDAAEWSFTLTALSEAMLHVGTAEEVVNAGRLAMRQLAFRGRSTPESPASQMDHILATVINSARLLTAAETIALAVDFRNDPHSPPRLTQLHEEYSRVRRLWKSLYADFRDEMQQRIG